MLIARWGGGKAANTGLLFAPLPIESSPKLAWRNLRNFCVQVPNVELQVSNSFHFCLRVLPDAVTLRPQLAVNWLRWIQARPPPASAADGCDHRLDKK